MGRLGADLDQRRGPHDGDHRRRGRPRKIAGASEPASYGFGLTNGPKWSIGSCAISGADTTAPIDVHNGAFGSSGNPSAPSVTTSGPNRLVLAFYANKKAATFSGYTSPAVERWDAPNPPGGLPSNAMASYELPTAGASGAKSAVPSEQEKWVAQQIAIAPAQGAGTTRFLWDPSFGVPQLALERDGNNATFRSYTYGARRISQTAGSNTSYFLYDGLGSVANATSAFGATQWTYGYEPFGTTRTEISNNGPANVMKFTGEHLDPTGLYHLRARQYDPGTGRFLTRDPVEPQMYSLHGSTYPYVFNRPTSLVDPLGLWGFSLCAGGEAAFGITFSGKVCLHVTGDDLPSEVGTSYTGSVGAAWKAGVDVGASGSVSPDVRHVVDYGGPSWSGGVFLDAGGTVEVTYQRGPDQCGRPINHYGFGLGGGLVLGGGPHVERNETVVTRTTGPWEIECPAESGK